MTRPDFNVSIPGAYSVTQTGSARSTVQVTDCRSASETTSGTGRRKPKGFIPPTPYTFRKREVEHAYGKAEVSVVKNNWSLYEGYVGRSPRFSTLNHFSAVLTEANAESTPTALKTSCLIAARNRLKAKKVDLGVAFAERKATAMTVGDTARRLAEAVKYLRRGMWRNAQRELGIRYKDRTRPAGSNWTNHWLQLQYGWKPLLADVYGSCDALSKRPNGDWRVTVKARRAEEDVFEYYAPKLGASYPTGNYDAYHGKAVRKRGVFTRIDALPQNDLTISLVSLGVTNPLLVAWELVPYSFVVDWFLPIGSWLDSLDALAGYGQAWTSQSTKLETTWVDKGLSYNWPNPDSYIRNNWLGTKRIVNLSRSVSTGVPVPSFPRFKDPVSLGHMANGLSLLAQAFGRG